jgi:transposase InsO family protein
LTDNGVLTEKSSTAVAASIVHDVSERLARVMIQSARQRTHRSVHRPRDIDQPKLRIAGVFKNHCDRFSHENLTPSMRRRGNCCDNAVAESFFGSLK